MPDLTRRAFLASASAPASAVFALPRRQPAEPATALALVGDRYHNADHYRSAFGKTFVRDMGLSIDFSDDVTVLNEERLGRYRMLIVLRDGMIWPDGHGNPSSNAGWWAQGQPEIVSDPPLPVIEPRSVGFMTPAMGRAVKRFVERGGAALLYHNVTYIARYNADFRAVLGAVTQGHPPVRPYRVEVVHADHPITRGTRDFVVTDEQHFMTYEGDPAHVLLRSHNDDGHEFGELGTSCEAGWAFDYGRGWVCYLSPGHTIPALWNPEYVKIQQHAVRWLLREL